MAYLNAFVLVGAVVVSLLLITLLIIKSRRQAQPQPETDLEQGVLPAATPLVTASAHNVWTNQESPVSQSQDWFRMPVSVKTKTRSSSQFSGGDVFQAKPGMAEETVECQLQSPKGTGVAMISFIGTLQRRAFEEETSLLSQAVPNQAESSGGDGLQSEAHTSEEEHIQHEQPDLLERPWTFLPSVGTWCTRSVFPKPEIPPLPPKARMKDPGEESAQVVQLDAALRGACATEVQRTLELEEAASVEEEKILEGSDREPRKPKLSDVRMSSSSTAAWSDHNPEIESMPCALSGCVPEATSPTCAPKADLETTQVNSPPVAKWKLASPSSWEQKQEADDPKGSQRLSGLFHDDPVPEVTLAQGMPSAHVEIIQEAEKEHTEEGGHSRSLAEKVTESEKEVQRLQQEKADCQERLAGLQKEPEEALSSLHTYQEEAKLGAPASPAPPFDKALLASAKLVGSGSFGCVFALNGLAIKMVQTAEHAARERDLLAMCTECLFITRLCGWHVDCLAMELLCCNLGEVLQKEPEVLFNGGRGYPVLFYSGCVVEALTFLHGQRIAHRDVKLENVLLDQQGYAKLADFGSAKVISGKTFTMAGSPIYMAPEILESHGHNCAADWWALGVLSFILLSPSQALWPVDGLSPEEQLVAVREGQKALGNLGDKVGGPASDLLELCLKFIKRLLVVDPEKRLGPQEVKKQKLFKAKMFWEVLRDKKLKAPYVPPRVSLA